MGTDSWLIVGYIAGILLFFAFKLILRYFEPIKEEDDDNDDFFFRCGFDNSLAYRNDNSYYLCANAAT